MFVCESASLYLFVFVFVLIFFGFVFCCFALTLPHFTTHTNISYSKCVDMYYFLAIGLDTGAATGRSSFEMGADLNALKARVHAAGYSKVFLWYQARYR